jgi:hypothetical protein
MDDTQHPQQPSPSPSQGAQQPSYTAYPYQYQYIYGYGYTPVPYALPQAPVQPPANMQQGGYGKQPTAPNYPVPTGHITRIGWGVGAIVVTILAVVLSLLASQTATHIPALGTPNYASMLTSDDGHWQIVRDHGANCRFTQNGLDAVTQEGDGSIAYPCVLTNAPGDHFHLRITIRSEFYLNNPLQAAIHAGGANFLFDASGSIEARPNVVTNSKDIQLVQSADWHTADTVSNVIDIIVDGGTYTLGTNGIQIFQGTINGTAAFGGQGIALGIYTVTGLSTSVASATNAETLFSDIAVASL